MKFGRMLGTVHFWRDRGAAYVDGFRTSLQVGFIGAGVAKGAGFTGATEAIILGIGVVVGLEVAKIAGGIMDHFSGGIEAQQQHIMDTNPWATETITILRDLHRIAREHGGCPLHVVSATDYQISRSHPMTKEHP